MGDCGDYGLKFVVAEIATPEIIVCLRDVVGNSAFSIGKVDGERHLAASDKMHGVVIEFGDEEILLLGRA